MFGYFIVLEGDKDFLWAIEGHAFTFYFFVFSTLFLFGEVVESKDHVFGRGGDGESVTWVKDIIRGEKQKHAFGFGFFGEWDVYGHGVTVEVSVEGSTDEWVYLYGFPFYEFGLEGLYTESVECGGTVEEDGVSFDEFIEDIPYDGFFLFDNFFGFSDGICDTSAEESVDDERFEEFGCHIFG